MVAAAMEPLRATSSEAGLGYQGRPLTEGELVDELAEGVQVFSQLRRESSAHGEQRAGVEQVAEVVVEQQTKGPLGYRPANWV